jgi:hypothetical protein
VRVCRTTAYFLSPADCDVIDIELMPPNGQPVFERFLVDSGFTGESSLVLPEDASGFGHAIVSASHASGALRGRQTRVLVTCRVPALAGDLRLIAILADVSSLSLPPGVRGIVGLSFLRRFFRWGSERRDDGRWQFFLSLADQDPVAVDLRLRSGSAAIDRGIVLPGLNAGFTGQAPDLGCYEQGQPVPQYGPRQRGAIHRQRSGQRL